MSMVSGVDAESDRAQHPSTLDELKRVFKRFDEDKDGKISATELHRCVMMKGLSVKRTELYPPWGEWSHSSTDHAEQITGLEADFLAATYYHNNFGNNVEYGCGYYNTRSMKHGAGDDVREHCIVDIPEVVNAINYQYPPEDDKRTKNYYWGLMAPVAEQAVAGVLANRIAAAGSDANNPWGVHFMEIAVVLGLSFKLAGVSLKRNKHSNSSIWMGKIGDVLTASAIILSLAMHLPPVMAWTAAPLAFLLIAFAVAFA